ncbi:MAG: methyltransferase domain-containing protein, partial [Hyphomicrobiaceae bacterium]|nr:methyltransferase domain-containing protein [Hyphomicrobiaceae bacterium]
MDKVKAQYERWIYPEPIEDLEAWIAGGAFSIGDAKHCGDIFWPATGYREGMNILVAGCGANQAAAIAYANPGARVVGTDVSASSLKHEKRLKKQHGLDNLELHELAVEKTARLDRDFDLVVATG